MTLPIEELWNHLTLGDKLQLIKLLKEEGLI
jgi:hypothetical protein